MVKRDIPAWGVGFVDTVNFYASPVLSLLAVGYWLGILACVILTPGFPADLLVCPDGYYVYNTSINADYRIAVVICLPKLTNGQLIVGRTGELPEAAPVDAGPGEQAVPMTTGSITIANGQVLVGGGNYVPSASSKPDFSKITLAPTGVSSPDDSMTIPLAFTGACQTSTVDATAIRVGNVIILRIPHASCTSRSERPLTSTVDLPVAFRPAEDVCHPTEVITGGQRLFGSMWIATEGTIRFFVGSGCIWPFAADGIASTSAPATVLLYMARALPDDRREHAQHWQTFWLRVAEYYTGPGPAAAAGTEWESTTTTGAGSVTLKLPETWVDANGRIHAVRPTEVHLDWTSALDALSETMYQFALFYYNIFSACWNLLYSMAFAWLGALDAVLTAGGPLVITLLAVALASGAMLTFGVYVVSSGSRSDV